MTNQFSKVLDVYILCYLLDEDVEKLCNIINNNNNNNNNDNQLQLFIKNNIDISSLENEIEKFVLLHNNNNDDDDNNNNNLNINIIANIFDNNENILSTNKNTFAIEDLIQIIKGRCHDKSKTCINVIKEKKIYINLNDKNNNNNTDITITTNGNSSKIIIPFVKNESKNTIEQISKYLID